MSEYKIPCDLIQDLMPLYIDGLTSEVTGAQIQEHLQICADCRKKYEMMVQSITATEGEKKIEEQKEIDYLKKVKKSSRKKLFIGFVSALVILLFAFCLKVFIIGYEANGYTVTNVNRVIDHSSVLVEGTFDGTKSVYKGYKLKTLSDGTQKVIIYGCLPSPWQKQSTFSFEIPYKSIKKELDIYGATVNKHGAFVSVLANKLYKAWNPYVGDMPANEKISQILGIRSALGDYKNELQAKKEPYCWTFHFKEKIPDTDVNNFDEKMKTYACLLIASIGNLDKVSWTYEEERPGENTLHKESITRKTGSDFINQEIFEKNPPIILQQMVYRLNKLNYTLYDS